MKKVNVIWVIIILLMLTGCGRNGQVDEIDDYISVDVTKSYPKKELILQDFMDVEYITMETTDDFITQGMVMDIGKEIIVVRNQIQDGDIFFFDRNGKGIRKINRRGGGSEEYLSITNIILDEESDELFIADNMAKKIMVYDLYGQFKRIIRYKEDSAYGNIYPFDRERLICRDTYFDIQSNTDMPFCIISKQDGNFIDISIPYKEKKTTSLMQVSDRNVDIMRISFFPIIPYEDSWILVEPSSDTIFRYFPDNNIIPFLIRTPSIQSMEPEVFLFPCILTDRYLFMKTEKKEYDFSTRQGFPKKYLMYNIQDETIFEYTVFNDDYVNKTIVDMAQKTVNSEIAFVQKIEAYELVESYKKGELKDGKLREIAAKLDEEDNPVIMLVKYKKK